MRFFRTSPEKLPAAESEMIFSKQDLKQLLLPLLAEQFLVVLIGMMDTIMVSYCGESAMSGVSLVDSINVLLIGVFSALATGGAVLVSQYLGQKRRMPRKLPQRCCSMSFCSFRWRLWRFA